MKYPDKGKPSERVGRKATGLSPEDTDTVAGLPGDAEACFTLFPTGSDCISPAHKETEVQGDAATTCPNHQVCFAHVQPAERGRVQPHMTSPRALAGSGMMFADALAFWPLNLPCLPG